MTDYAKRHAFSFDPRLVLSAFQAFLASKDAESLKAHEMKQTISQIAKQSSMNFALRQCQRREELIRSLLMKRRSS